MSVDITEAPRRARIAELNAEVREMTDPRAELEAKYGQVWDTTQLQNDFEVQAFRAPFVVARRKADGVKGTLEFTHSPRYYFGFQKE